MLAGDENATVLTGDWGEVLPPEAPFDLLFADGGRSKYHEEVLGLLAPGGTLVLDNLTPGHQGSDPVRELWLGHPRVLATEVQISSREAVIVAHFSLADVLPIGERMPDLGEILRRSPATR